MGKVKVFGSFGSQKGAKNFYDRVNESIGSQTIKCQNYLLIISFWTGHSHSFWITVTDPNLGDVSRFEKYAIKCKWGIFFRTDLLFNKCSMFKINLYPLRKSCFINHPYIRQRDLKSNI